jgi:hypothetical protein
MGKKRLITIPVEISFFHFHLLLSRYTITPPGRERENGAGRCTNGSQIIGTINCIRFVTIYKMFSPANASLIIFTQ